jgi:hypothetical protein
MAVYCAVAAVAINAGAGVGQTRMLEVRLSVCCHPRHGWRVDGREEFQRRVPNAKKRVARIRNSLRIHGVGIRSTWAFVC